MKTANKVTNFSENSGKNFHMLHGWRFCERLSLLFTYSMHVQDTMYVFFTDKTPVGLFFSRAAKLFRKFD